MLIKFFLLCYKISPGFLRRHLISLIGRIEGGQAFSKTIRIIMQKYHGISIGIGTYGPCFNLDQTWVGTGNLVIGNYTSIAKGVCIYSRNHPYERPSTSPFFYSGLYRQDKKDDVEFGKLEIGNDVWIGQYAIILPSCHVVGDGAVIGAGCVVTKDVPPYAIVVGNPGKVIRYRFEPHVIDMIQNSKWWEKTPQELEQIREAFRTIEEFKRQFCEEKNVGEQDM